MDEAVIDQTLQTIQNRLGWQLAALRALAQCIALGAHRLSCFQRPATREHGQPAEEDLLGRLEQVVTPGNRLPQGLSGWQQQ